MRRLTAVVGAVVLWLMGSAAFGQTWLGAWSEDTGQYTTNIRLELHPGAFPGKIPDGYSVTGPVKTASVRWTSGRDSAPVTRVWTVPAVFEGQRYVIFAHDGDGPVKTVTATYRRTPIRFDEGCGFCFLTRRNGQECEWHVWAYDETP